MNEAFAARARTLYDAINRVSQVTARASQGDVTQRPRPLTEFDEAVIRALIPAAQAVLDNDTGGEGPSPEPGDMWQPTYEVSPVVWDFSSRACGTLQVQSAASVEFEVRSFADQYRQALAGLTLEALGMSLQEFRDSIRDEIAGLVEPNTLAPGVTLAMPEVLYPEAPVPDTSTINYQGRLMGPEVYYLHSYSFAEGTAWSGWYSGRTALNPEPVAAPVLSGGESLGPTGAGQFEYMGAPADLGSVMMLTGFNEDAVIDYIIEVLDI